MDVKKAIKIAKTYVADIFSDEKIDHLGLEETGFDESKNVWLITIGFARKWNPTKIGGASLPTVVGPNPYENRTFKQVAIDDKSGRVLYVKDRILREAA
ncbi:hypothetical protein [Salaquimonas pukyongi]|uniref:hypothetical protein n=1 Tax=Salaquimonas pukyongi TaxID=2712698 RepID=UPI00096B9E25|nr:hypothetical protein [Salaquimonas pukyongi]